MFRLWLIMDFERLKLEVYSILRRLARLELRTIIKSIDSDTTLTFSEVADTFLVSCPSGNVLIILPSVSTTIGRPYTIKKIDAVNIVNIQPIEFSTIDGNLTYQLTTQWESITFVSDGSQFYITSKV